MFSISVVMIRDSVSIVDFDFDGSIGSDDFLRGLDGGSRCLFLFIWTDCDCFYVSRDCFLYRVFLR